MIVEIQERLNQYLEAGYESVLLGLTDIDGVLRGKYVSLDKFGSLLQKGGGFCDCVFGWDINDQLYHQAKYTGWHTGFPDTKYRLLVDTERFNSLTNTPFFLGEFVDINGNDHPICPRSILRKVVNQIHQLGFSVKAGFEYEFFVFNETSKSVRDKNYQQLLPYSEGNFGYSVLRAASNASDFRGLLEFCEEFEITLEGLHCETGPGVWEAALEPTDVCEAADRATLLKTFSKAYFQQRDKIATYMAKWSMDYPGQSGHFHFSLIDEKGNNALEYSGGELNQTAQYVIGGLTSYLPTFLSLFAPTVNSYTRLVKGAWAPTSSTWGIENRTCAVRFVNAQNNQHIEHRVPGADSNPYLVAAGSLAACVLGIRKKVLPPSPVQGNAYDQNNGVEPDFPTNLSDAAMMLDASNDAQKILGKEFVEHFVMSRVWEHNEAYKSVNDWQLQRYFESI